MTAGPPDHRTSRPKDLKAYKPMGLYIHIPFCKKKCNYCDFVSYAGKEDMIDGYIEKLINEIHCSDLGLRISDLNTVFFGGGTPTLLPPKHFENIISTLIRHWKLDIGHSEISIEANPGTADLARLKALRSLGINRLSIGVQSFNDRHLKTLGRIHDSNDIFRFYDDARSAGFENINLDLIFALPGQTLDEWKKDIETAINLKPDHLSTYSLQIEEGTPLWDMTKNERITHYALRVTSEETEAAMFEYAIETLAANGYHHYEISNFSRPGFECRHNLNYWKMGDWLGVGAGAHSHVDGKRWSNTEKIEEYIHGSSPTPHASEQKKEALFMGLRLLEGLPAEKFDGFEAEVEDLMKDGLLENEKGRVKLTRRGLFLGNLVFEKFV